MLASVGDCGNPSSDVYARGGSQKLPEIFDPQMRSCAGNTGDCTASGGTVNHRNWVRALHVISGITPAGLTTSPFSWTLVYTGLEVTIMLCHDWKCTALQHGVAAFQNNDGEIHSTVCSLQCNAVWSRWNVVALTPAEVSVSGVQLQQMRCRTE